MHPQGRINLLGQADVMLMRQCPVALQRFGNKGCNRHLLRLYLHLPGSQFVEVQQIRNQPLQAVAVAQGQMQHLVQLWWQFTESTGEYQAQGSVYGGQRGTQLMADVGDKVFLQGGHGVPLIQQTVKCMGQLLHFRRTGFRQACLFPGGGACG